MARLRRNEWKEGQTRSLAENSRPWVKLSADIATDPVMVSQIRAETFRAYFCLVANIAAEGIGDLYAFEPGTLDRSLAWLLGHGRDEMQMSGTCPECVLDASELVQDMTGHVLTQLCAVEIDGREVLAIRVPAFFKHNPESTDAERKRVARGGDSEKCEVKMVRYYDDFRQWVGHVRDTARTVQDASGHVRPRSRMEKEKKNVEEERESTSTPPAKKQGKPLVPVPARSLSNFRDDPNSRPRQLTPEQRDRIESDYPIGSGRGFDGPTWQRVQRLIDDRHTTFDELHATVMAYRLAVEATGHTVTKPFNFFDTSESAGWRAKHEAVTRQRLTPAQERNKRSREAAAAVLERFAE